MKKAQCAASPAKSETPSSKRLRPADSHGTTSPAGKDIADILESIDRRLSSFDARLSLVEILHREFKCLRESLEFSQQQVETLAAENATLRESVKCLTENVTQLNRENKKIKETVIDLQARSMRDNLVFSGIPEAAGEDVETTVKNFIKTHLKLPEDMVKNIVFDRVHRLGPIRAAGRETTSYRGQIRPLQTKGTCEKPRQGIKRNGLQRERPVPQRDPGMTQGPLPNPMQLHPEGLPRCHRCGPAVRGRTAPPRPRHHSVAVLTSHQIRIRYTLSPSTHTNLH
ncbi:uncharacterized protein LOC112846383 [Oreochromis niloticus]|uniref:uncharacterized protein LOC112846383 n=1 Tax=Oreochromis niloticus TaxID=8128 RepID=UPI000DF2FE1A|nr:uncharacterized protein LOC112846383 [Oreochromis niloticus]